MKKLIIILIVVLALIYTVFTILGKDSENEAEKLYYQGQRIHRQIKANPEVVPPKMLLSAEEVFKKIIKQYPETETARLTYDTLVEFYLMHKKYDQAQATLEEIQAKYGEDKSVASRVQFLKGFIYEKQDLWDQALTEYALLRDNPEPDEQTIRNAMAGNLCRCTGYTMIVEAVTLAAKRRGAAW